MANPYFVMNNSDPQERKSEWNRRQRLDIEHEQHLKRQRRLKQLRKAKKSNQ